MYNVSFIVKFLLCILCIVFSYYLYSLYYVLLLYDYLYACIYMSNLYSSPITIDPDLRANLFFLGGSSVEIWLGLATPLDWCNPGNGCAAL